MNHLDEIKSKALQLGFDLVGITDASPIDQQQIKLLSDWLSLGYAGRMDFMHRNFKMRIDPAQHLQNAQSVICLALNYRPARPYSSPASSKSPLGVADEPIEADCSNCDKCITACPAGALRPDGYFDANKCISYLTIEYKGEIPANLARKISNCLFGCDECVHACPYYQKAPPCQNSSFKFYPGRAQLDLQQLLSMSQADFDTKFADSPLMRIGLEKLKRNAGICLANITDCLLRHSPHSHAAE